MKTLLPKLIPHTDLSEPLPGLDRFLLITDRPEYAAAAAAGGLAFVSCNAGEIAVEKDHFTAGVQTVVVACSGEGVPSYEEVFAYAQNCAQLLRSLVDVESIMHLILIEEENEVLTSVLDGMSLSVAAEENLTTSVVRVKDRVNSESLLAWIAAATQSPGEHLQVDGQAVSRVELKQTSLDAEHSRVFPGEVIVLVGGAGGVGIEVCRYLARQGATVVVMGRQKPDTSRIKILQDAGASLYVRISPGCPNSIDRAMQYVYSRLGRISTAINMAGTLRDTLIRAVGNEQIDAVFRPKAGVSLALAGIHGLHRPSRIVHFGSLSAVTGNVGQSAYGGANAFIRRLSEVNPDTQCIEWGLWDTNGMQLPDKTSKVKAMNPDAASEALIKAIGSKEPRLVIYDGEPEFSSRHTVAKPDDQEGLWHEDMMSSAKSFVRNIICRHTGLEKIGDDENLLDYGVDSVTSVRISRDIESRLKGEGESRLSRALVLQYPTISKLTNHLVEKIGLPLVEDFATRELLKPEKSPDSSEKGLLATTTSSAGQLGDTSVSSLALGRPDDIAIVGMAGEFPNADNVSAYWDNLVRGEDGVTEIPGDRWSWKREYEMAMQAGRPMPGRHGGFISHAYEFDPTFFGIAPAEAKKLDPQERRFLQTAYHAWENSGCFATESQNQNTGVFVSVMFSHYQNLDDERPVSGSFAAIANRVSHALDLHGPSIALDTMCSGGLTAVHLAMNAIRSGECDTTIAGGVNIMSHPGKYRVLTEQKFLQLNRSMPCLRGSCRWIRSR